MSMIEKFYDEYMEHESGATAEWDNVTAIITEVVTGGATSQGGERSNIIEIEDAITALERTASKAGFTAGFKAAMRLLQEVRA